MCLQFKKFNYIEISLTLYHLLKLIYLILSFCLLINLAQQAYSSKVASQLAYMSDIAYQSQANINAWNCSLCNAHKLIGVKVFSNSTSDIQGFTGYSTASNAIILAIRGSSNIKNWIINLSFNQVPYPKCTNCKVHSGFLSAYNGLKSTIINQLQSLVALYRTSTIYVTGHSLGGAIALLASTDIKDLIVNPNFFITFGEPRVGNDQFAKWISSQVINYRVVHYADIVPHIPPQFQGFIHGGIQVWYDEAMKNYKICEGESPSCSNSLSFASYNSADHSMDIYITLNVAKFDLLKDIQYKVSAFIQKLSWKRSNLIRQNSQ